MLAVIAAILFGVAAFLAFAHIDKIPVLGLVAAGLACLAVFLVAPAPFGRSAGP